MLTRSDVLVIVPAYNEEATVAAVVRDVRDAGFRLLVVSDGSTDGTVSLAREAGATVLPLPVNLGVGGALRAGFRFACNEGFSAVVQVDADGQHPPTRIDSLIEAANSTGADLVIGSRFRTSESSMQIASHRRFAMRILAITASVSARRKLSDVTSGFRLIRSPLLNEFARTFPSNYLGDTYEATVAAARAGYQVHEIPAPLMPRRAGESSANSIQGSLFTLKAISVALTGLHPLISRTPRREGEVQRRRS
jgi:glycosyltransferase involved in cell wall biosynthesis